MSDSDQMDANRLSADSAQVAIDAFIQVTGVNAESAVADLLCDIMHLCAANGHDFDSIMVQAKQYFDEESA